MLRFLIRAEHMTHYSIGFSNLDWPFLGYIMKPGEHAATFVSGFPRNGGWMQVEYPLHFPLRFSKQKGPTWAVENMAIRSIGIAGSRPQDPEKDGVFYFDDVVLYRVPPNQAPKEPRFRVVAEKAKPAASEDSF